MEKSVVVVLYVFLFFKQKTAYEMRISDWSSDVCSSDLAAAFLRENGNPFDRIGSDVQSSVQIALGSSGVPETFLIDGKGIIREQIQGVTIGRASCRERVWQYV